MAINTANGTMASQPPRMVYTVDNRNNGCPGPAVAGPYGGSSTLISQTITVSASSLVWIAARCIYNYSGRCDTSLYIDNVGAGIGALNWVYDDGTTQWEEHWICFATTLAAGTHYIELRETTGGGCNSRFGCNTDWGDISTLIWEQ